MRLLVKEYRLKRDLSMRDLEKISTVPRSVISKIENNNTYNPKVYTVCKLAVALKVPLDELVKY